MRTDFYSTIVLDNQYRLLTIYQFISKSFNNNDDDDKLVNYNAQTWLACVKFTLNSR